MDIRHFDDAMKNNSIPETKKMNGAVSSINMVDGSILTEASPLDELLVTLVAFVDGSVRLEDDEVLSLKSWLVVHAQNFEPGCGLKIQRIEPQQSITCAAIGKSSTGECILWHEPLPWTGEPFFDGTH